MDKTFLDELVEYPVKALYKIGMDQTVVGLLTDNPDIDVDSDDADEVFDRYLFDYGYVDNTTTEAAAYICVEAEASGSLTESMHNMKLYVTIFCHKQFMDIEATKFKGMVGNRRDNLVRYVDALINGSDVFGIGKLTLDSVRSIPCPIGFSARELTYTVPDFRRKGVR